MTLTVGAFHAALQPEPAAWAFKWLPVLPHLIVLFGPVPYLVPMLLLEWGKGVRRRSAAPPPVARAASTPLLIDRRSVLVRASTLVSLHTEPAVAAAIQKSVLRDLPPATIVRLFEHAVLIDVPPGALSQQQGKGTMVPGFVVSGLLRVFITTPDGRQVTIRYARPGSLLAIATLYMKRTGSVSQQALTPVHTVRFWPDTLLEAARKDPAVANLFAAEVSTRLFEFLDELAGNTFGTMRQRVVRHLLDLAAKDHGRAPLVAHVSQQALADAAGTVREVVVRTLRELREEGLIRTGRDEIELLQPESLLSETFPR